MSSHENSEKSGRMQKFLVAVRNACIGMAISIILMLLAALLISLGMLPEGFMYGAGSVLCGLGCLIAAFLTAKTRRSGGIATGIISGLCCFAVIYTVYLIAFMDPSVTWSGFFKTLSICLISGLIGGILGVNTR